MFILAVLQGRPVIGILYPFTPGDVDGLYPLEML